jgi:hypothetical protein
VTCESVVPVVTGGARPDPQIPDAVRTQYGPGRRRPRSFADRVIGRLRAGGGHGGAELLVRDSLLVPIRNEGSELGVVDSEIER